MADRNTPNDASRKSKAEGERFNASDDMAAANQAGGADEEAGGITNRPLDEEIENQRAVPDRGESKAGAHAGHGDKDIAERGSER